MTRAWILALTVVLGFWAGFAEAQAQEQLPAAGATPSANYIIGPGDTLKVFVWSHADLSVVVPVSSKVNTTSKACCRSMCARPR